MFTLCRGLPAANRADEEDITVASMVKRTVRSRPYTPSTHAKNVPPLLENSTTRKTDIQVPVTSIWLGSVGFDFHGACCKGIVLGWPWNANLMNQALGRLIRTYQKRFVDW